MAEALWRAYGKGQWDAFSAGSKPVGYVHPLAIQVMTESGYDISANRSKHVDEFRDQAFDVVVTVCDSARETCPILAGAVKTLHWPFDDPAHATGSDAEKLAVFRRVRDEIKGRIAEYLANP
jgi:arsenate reductase